MLYCNPTPRITVLTVQESEQTEYQRVSTEVQTSLSRSKYRARQVYTLPDCHKLQKIIDPLEHHVLTNDIFSALLDPPIDYTCCHLRSVSQKTIQLTNQEYGSHFGGIDSSLAVLSHPFVH